MFKLFKRKTWETVHTGTKTYSIRFSQSYRKRGFIQIQESEYGDERAYLVHANGKHIINLDWAKAKEGLV